MERLTERSKNSDMVWFKDTENNSILEPCEMSAHHSRMAIAKLAEYEDAEEQGLISRLPKVERLPKVGDAEVQKLAKLSFLQKRKQKPN